MKKMRMKRIFAILLVCCMMTALFPAAALADEDLPGTQEKAAAEQSGVTLVSTANELFAAVDAGVSNIQLGADIMFSGYILNFTSDTMLDLAGYTLSAADSDNAHCVLSVDAALTISNGTVTFDDEAGCAIAIDSGSLSLWNSTVEGGIRNYGTSSRLHVVNSLVDFVSGGTFAGDSSAGIPAIVCLGTIDELKHCTVVYDNPDGSGTGALIVGYSDGSQTGAIGSITACTFIGSGSMVSGISLFSGSIGSISNSTITGSGDRAGLVNNGFIGSITVGADNYIDSIDSGEIGTIGSSEVDLAINNYGEIGSISHSTIEGLYDSICNRKSGSIGEISENTLIATAEYGRAIETSGTINTIKNNISELPKAGDFIVVHVGGEVGEITGNTADAPITNAGMNGGGTVGLIENNTVTTTGLSAIQNTGTITKLGDNTLSSGEGGVGVSNSGTIETVSVSMTKLSDTLYRSASGWTLQNDGTITNITLAGALSAPVVTVSNKASTGKIVISWTAVAGAEKYELYCSTSGKSGTFSRIWSGKSTSVTHSSAKAGTTYYYRVRAVSGSTKGALSAVKARTCDLAQPVVTIGNNASSGKIVLSWEKVAGAVKYEIWASTSKNGSYSKLGTVTGTSVTHNSAKAGKTYYYKVRAIAGDTKGAASAAVGKTCDLARPVVTITLNSNGKPVVSWATVEGAVKYKVYRSVDGGDYTLLTTTTNTKITNTKVTSGVKYRYKVVAIASVSSANSAASAVKSVTVG